MAFSSRFCLVAALSNTVPLRIELARVLRRCILASEGRASSKAAAALDGCFANGLAVAAAEAVATRLTSDLDWARDSSS